MLTGGFKVANVYSDLTLVRRAKGDYDKHLAGKSKYILCSGIYSYERFDSREEVELWTKRLNLNAVLIDGTDNEDEYGYYQIEGVITEYLFWSLGEIPIEADMFVGKANGSDVHCFSLATETGATIWRPNPNAKEVYRGLSIAEYAKFKRGEYTDDYVFKDLFKK